MPSPLRGGYPRVFAEARSRRCQVDAISLLSHPSGRRLLAHDEKLGHRVTRTLKKNLPWLDAPGVLSAGPPWPYTATASTPKFASLRGGGGFPRDKPRRRCALKTPRYPNLSNDAGIRAT